MSAKEKIEISRLGIIAGGGELPSNLIDACEEQNIIPYLICFEGFTDPDLISNYKHLWTRLGAASQIINFFKDNDVKDIVLIGDIKRPSLANLSPDWKGVQILSRIGLRAMGDNSLLGLVKEELQKEGLTVRGIQEFCPSLLIGVGSLGKFNANKLYNSSIDFGVRVSQTVGSMDIGQSVIVQDGVIVGVEAKEGTDELIKRCAPLLDNKGKGGILVKTCKPQQDKSLDLPTVGLNTVRAIHDAGMSGMALHAHNVMIPNLKDVADFADKYKIFIVGVDIPKEVL